MATVGGLVLINFCGAAVQSGCYRSRCWAVCIHCVMHTAIVDDTNRSVELIGDVCPTLCIQCCWAPRPVIVVYKYLGPDTPSGLSADCRGVHHGMQPLSVTHTLICATELAICSHVLQLTQLCQLCQTGTNSTNVVEQHRYQGAAATSGACLRVGFPQLHKA